ncbi:hypothetical protein VNO78_09465 [Psophocarpus tetragonolobus]|uniref:Protein kinase domain-containing protein n=1 Tax=Psophocarpus tetragonolobus TaxID=3891 RepID=A0AAN9XT87_PSOTE
MASSPLSPHHLLLATFISLSFHLSLTLSLSPDFYPLISFKAASDPSNKLSQWNSTSPDPCSWHGVSCLPRNRRVSAIVLENLNLTGSILPLTSLSHLRILSLKANRFHGPLPPSLANLSSLTLLYLNHNHFSGPLPPSLTALTRLFRLDLSHNSLSGPIPLSLNRFSRLLTLRLHLNNFHGHLPNLSLPNLVDFNVSSNHLSGPIPLSLSSFPQSAFSHNSPSLCGPPLTQCTHKAIPALASPLNPRNDTVFSPQRRTPKLGLMLLLLIVLADLLVLAFVSLLLYCYFCRKRNHSGEGKEVRDSKERGEDSQMVFFEGEKRFQLDDLLRASAEMLGKGVFGTAYKAVLHDGTLVAVKRIKEVSVGGKREFHQRMQELGSLRHCNLVAFRAYYFAKHEKLLVSDYMPNASLSYLLHGNRGPGRTPLDWSSRVKLAGGAARGVAFLHDNKVTHGNIKSTNVLVDVAGNARIADFGLSIFAAPTTPNAYRAPDARKHTHMSDVYSFGVLLLEILTGKCPSAEAPDLPRWVRSVVREEWTAEVFDLELMSYRDVEEEMVAMLHIAIACTATAPDQRPTMSHVANMIQDLRPAGTRTQSFN